MAGSNTSDRIRVLSLKKQFGGGLSDAEEAEFARLKAQLRSMKIKSMKDRR